MKPVLVLALGSPVFGDDDVGAHVLAALADDPEVAAVAELGRGGTDLFRLADRIPGRGRLVLVDAALGTGAARVVVRRHPPNAPGERRTHAHDLDPVAALELLRRHDPAIAAVPAWWLLLDVPELALRAGLSATARTLVKDAAVQLRALVLEPACPELPPKRSAAAGLESGDPVQRPSRCGPSLQ